MKGRILITGGAGFIGSHLADELLNHGYSVRVLDNLSPQVHGPECTKPTYLNPDVEFVLGDVRDQAAVRRSLAGIDAVFHFAAAVGVGQSMYEIGRYTDINNMGTAVVVEEMLKLPISKLLVASSMSVYGEGLYRDAKGTLVPDARRTLEELRRNKWEPVGQDSVPLEPLPTTESKQPDLMSVYALSKYHQEQICLLLGRAYNVPTVAMRFFNVYGPRQALSNPYTGVLAIFASRYLNGKPPVVFEDGLQKRDFVSVYDVCRACRLALESPSSGGETFNVGSGHSYTVLDIASRMAHALNAAHIEPTLTGTYRVGDIRHCFADISKARSLLGYMPQHILEDAMIDLVQWLEGRDALDYVDSAHAELAQRGLTV